MKETKATWRSRVASWRTSGETAAAFSRQQGCAPATLRWYASQFKREEAERTTAAPLVRMAQVIRSSAVVDGARRGGVVIDLLDVRARITVDRGVERETLALVLTTLGVGVAR